jgi:hypothetical protein
VDALERGLLGGGVAVALTARWMRALMLSIALVGQIIRRISGSNAWNGTSSARVCSHRCAIAGLPRGGRRPPGNDGAVRLANDSRFGLGSNVWTSDLDRGEEIATMLDAGHTAVHGLTASDPRLPFGGVKDSGYGRELSSYGLYEFVNVHTVVVNDPYGPAGDDTRAVE